MCRRRIGKWDSPVPLGYDSCPANNHILISIRDFKHHASQILHDIGSRHSLSIHRSWANLTVEDIVFRRRTTTTGRTSRNMTMKRQTLPSNMMATIHRPHTPILHAKRQGLTGQCYESLHREGKGALTPTNHQAGKPLDICVWPFLQL